MIRHGVGALIALVSFAQMPVHGATMNANLFVGRDAELESAVLADDRTGIARAIASGAQPDARGMQGVTPLMLAVDRLKIQAVSELLSRGADPNARAADGSTPVTLAVENYKRSAEILASVVRAGGDPNARRPDNDPVIMRFVNDRNCEFIRQWKAFGANLDIVTRTGDPLISAAAIGQDWDVVWCLLELGARFDYEGMRRAALSRPLASRFPAPDSPIYPYKRKVWQFLRERGVAVPPLNE